MACSLCAHCKQENLIIGSCFSTMICYNYTPTTFLTLVISPEIKNVESSLFRPNQKDQKIKRSIAKI